MPIPADSLPGDHLRAEEKEELRKILCRAIRAETAPISDTTLLLSERLEQCLCADAKGAICLGKGEMRTLKKKLQRTIHADARHTSMQDSLTERFFQRLSELSRSTFPRMAAVCCLLLIVGNTVAFAASDALPGDRLYPVKVKVLEPVRGIVAVTPEAKAKWASDCVRRRLSEAERLIVQDRLTAEAWQALNTSITANAEVAEKHIIKLSKSSAPKAADLSADLHIVLHAHGQVFADAGQIQDLPVVAEAAADISSVAAKTAQLYEQTEKDASDDIASIEQALKRVMQSASNATFSISDTADTKIHAVPAHALQRADMAKQFMKSAQDRMEAGQLRESLHDARMAVQKAEEGNVFMRMNSTFETIQSVSAGTSSAASVEEDGVTTSMQAERKTSHAASKKAASVSSDISDSSAPTLSSSQQSTVVSVASSTPVASPPGPPVDLPLPVPENPLLH